jgi:hypothetical protein
MSFCSFFKGGSMAINDGNRPIVDDSTIFGKDAFIETGRNTNIPKGNKGEQGSKEEGGKKKRKISPKKA